jgi:hypothetical protein
MLRNPFQSSKDILNELKPKCTFKPLHEEKKFTVHNSTTTVFVKIRPEPQQTEMI